MPTYDYQCQACGHRFELFQSMTAKVKRKCPACEKPKLERLIGPGAGFLFKGDGFYITDYRSDSYRAGQKAAEDSSKSPTTSPEKSADKSADKAADKAPAKTESGGAKKADSSPKTKASKGKNTET